MMISNAGAIKFRIDKQGGEGEVTLANFEQLYKRYCQKIYSLCLRVLQSEVDAEDVTQEVFVQVYRRLHTFRGRASFATWLYRITVNQVLMHLRRSCAKKRREEVVLDEPIDGLDQRWAEHNESIRLTDRTALEQAIGQLPLGYRIIFILHDVEGLNHNEIASLLGLSVGTTKSQLHKARLRLRRLLRRGPRRRPVKPARPAVPFPQTI